MPHVPVPRTLARLAAAAIRVRVRVQNHQLGKTQGLRLLAMLTLVILALLTPKPVFPLDKVAIAAKYAAEGLRAYETLNYKKAAELYMNAWKNDPKPDYLWYLARSESLGDQNDLALEHYRAFVATPGAAADRVNQAREFIDLIAPSSLRARIRNADNAATAGETKKAAALYLEAYNVARERWDVLLFKAAVQEDEAKDWPAAVAHFEEYLKHTPDNTPERPQAVARLDRLRRQLRGEPVTPAEIANVGKAESKELAWSLVRIGGALALVGAGSYVWTRTEQSRLEANLQPGPNGKIQALSREEAREQVKSVNEHLVVALALGGVGLAAAGVGTYLLLRTDSKVAVLPGPVPASLALEWQF